jgi:hypothetical protein
VALSSRASSGRRSWELDPHGALAGDELERVVEQVIEDLHEAIAIAMDVRQLRRYLESQVDAPLRGCVSKRIARGSRDLAWITGLTFDEHFTSIHARDVDEVVRPALHDLARAADLPGEPAVRVRNVGRLGEQLRLEADDVEVVTQVVRDHREHVVAIAHV